MIRYQVVDLSRDGSLMSMLDTEGRLHVARIRGAEVLRDDVLVGRQAKMGAHVLMAQGRNTPLRVSFESVSCTQEQALALMHPDAAPDPSTPRAASAGSVEPHPDSKAGGRRR